MSTPEALQARADHDPVHNLLDNVCARVRNIQQELDAVPMAALDDAHRQVERLLGAKTGRAREARLLIDALRTRKIAPVIAPPGFGKTALLRRALLEVTDGKTIHDPALRGIIYLDARDLGATFASICRTTGQLTGQPDSWQELAASPDSVEVKTAEYWNHWMRSAPSGLFSITSSRTWMDPTTPPSRTERSAR